MNKHCHSCGMMLTGEEGQKARGNTRATSDAGRVLHESHAGLGRVIGATAEAQRSPLSGAGRQDTMTTRRLP